MVAKEDLRIAVAVAQQGVRLRRFIRRRVADAAEAEDILQDVWTELVTATRFLPPIEEMTAWLFRVAGNRIVDRARLRRPQADEPAGWEDLLPSRDAGPEAAFARRVLAAEIAAAIEELPEDQREAFVAREIEGRSLQELATETGASVNALTLRKHQVERGGAISTPAGKPAGDPGICGAARRPRSLRLLTYCHIRCVAIAPAS